MEPKERIQQKAHDMFMQYGIRSVSMDDIATQLGMSKKTLYQYYADKDELVNAVLTAILEGNQSRCMADKQQADNAIHELFLAFEMIRELFGNMNPSVVFDLEKYHPDVFRKFQQYKSGFLYQVISQNLQRGIQEELYRPEISIDILCRFRIGTTMMVFDPEIFPDNRNNLVNIEAEIFYHFLHGLATAKGEKLIEKYRKEYQHKTSGV
jgi:AcrR family transcriptional regulator